ncbi:MAG TPA: cobalt-precorrin-5B (C(1))-methyltransferase [Pirellulales bacterium]|jgi:cobalt-precorrin-5B (C1)-methyltransferase|nr:cobalt-precorrin-5B (C(1))-methyltransferase [Pirellulales bacterium]
MSKSKENLRSGYTTGACATAATKAALLALIGQRTLDDVTIRLPIGQQVAFALHRCQFTAGEAVASVIKDAGDDPDVTHQAEIGARVGWAAEVGVFFLRGQGVGLVTRPGLPVPTGEPAINPIPRRMIRETIADVLAAAGRTGQGVNVEIFVPRGEELAKKTFNPRLGIVGGISILGTTGIVVPYSTTAWVASVVQAIDVAAAQGEKHLVLTVGARGERVAQSLFDLPEVAFVQIGPFFGQALRHCAGAGIARVSLLAMIGKLAKFAAGNESVHSTQSHQDFDFLARLAQTIGADDALAAQIRAANTAQEVSSLVAARGLAGFYSLLCERAWHFAQGFVSQAYDLEIFVTGIAEQVLGRFPSDGSE